MVLGTYTSKKRYPRLPHVEDGTLDIAHGLIAQYEQICVLVVLNGAIMQHQEVNTMCSIF